MSVVAFLLLELLAITAINISFCNGSSYMGCIQSEREALLRFKQDLEDPSNRLASWNGDGDCCTWEGVVCNNFTGNVLELHLTSESYPISYDFSAQIDRRRSRFGGKINPSLLNLKHLTYLDLSANNFKEIQIPEFLGSMGSLRYLNLSSAGFEGIIPHQLGNLSNLQYLDLGHKNDFQSLYVENFSWLSGLSLLKKLDLSDVNISKASKELLVINALPSLQFLSLSNCGLHRFPPLSFVNFSSLTFLDLSGNNIQGTIPDGLQNLTSLKYLNLGYNDFNSSVPNWLYKLGRLEDLSLAGIHWQGTISSAVGNLSFLKTLDLSDSNLEGGIPTSFRRFCNLRSISMSGMNLNQDISEVLEIFSKCVSVGLESLDLDSSNLFGHLTNQLGQFKNLEFLNLFNNSISGPFPSSLGELSSLRILALSDNKLNGTLSEVHFSGLTKLIGFAASGSSLMFKNSAEWIPPFKLQILLLRSCHFGSQFPSWLHSQKHLLVLDISNSSILDTLPAYLFKAPFQIVHLNLSHNQMYGKIPNLMESSKLDSLDLSSNNLSGPLPLTPFNMHELNLSNNSLSGSISHFLCYKMNEAKRLMQILILSKNFFHGELPDCLVNWQNLIVLKLDYNKFTGNLPTTIGTLSFLQSLHLRNNKLSGPLPVSIKNCTELQAFDASKNEFTGNIPAWIGESFSRMKFLNLHSNKFYGLLPVELCHLTSLQIVDLANNNFWGIIPRCIGNFSAMTTQNHSVQVDENYIDYSSDAYFSPEDFFEDASLVMKGRIFEYSTILNLVRAIDLSNNNFSGEIPVELTNLGALKLLNLSHNHFTGRIPENIGVMLSLECVDFSGNKLSGKIPQSISSMSFLSSLNLSNNNLVGKIPLSTQLQSLEASSFTGNELCGPPLIKNCTATIPTSDHDSGGGNDDGNEHEVDWFYVGMALGFMVGFWGVISPLLISRRWRVIHFHFLDSLWIKFCAIVRKCF